MTLPISPLLPQIVSVLAQSPGLVLQAEPGAGKSTAVPLALLQADWLADKKILMLEPRRLAVRSIAHFLATQLGEQVGQTVGFQVRNERKVSTHTRLEIVTEGILTRRLQHDPELSDVGLIIFDEFHERSIHADLALTLCLEVQSALRDDLKLLVMSATIDTEQVSAFLNQAPVLQAQGRSYPVETFYLPQPLTSTHPNDWLPVLKRTIQQALQKGQQDVLVFLPGQREIQQTLNALNENPPPGLVIRPLYGSLPLHAQEQAIRPDSEGRRKVVLATNIAETSLTIEGIDTVVDAGWVRKAIYDVSSGMTRMTTQRISKASAEQRKGRAGRLMPGVCYRLWSESQQAQLPDFEREEITQADLSGLCIELAQWGVSEVNELNWLTPPPPAHFQAAKSLLQDLDLLNQHGQLTALGKQAHSFGVEPRLARILLDALNASDLDRTLACDLAAILSEGDILLQSHQADLIQRVLALQAYRQNRDQAKKSYALHIGRTEQALKNAQNWRRALKVSQPQACSLAQMQQKVGEWVALAYPDRIAQRRKGDAPRYLLANGKGASLREDDAMNHQAWLAVAELDGQRQEGRIFLAAPLDLAMLKTRFAAHIKTQSRLDYDAQKQTLNAVEQVRFGKLVLEQKPQPRIDSAAFQAALLELLADNLALLPWSEATTNWLNRVNWLSAYQNDWPTFDQAWLSANIETWLSPYLHDITSIKALQKLDLRAILNGLLDYDKQQTLEQQAPAFYHAPSQKRVPIVYSASHDPKVSIQLQEVFGELSSPMLAWGQVPLTFELLSPARRPIQTTADLANFWRSSYFDVIKEMKGRYPKHRWPDKPLEEKPGRSIKAKR